MENTCHRCGSVVEDGTAFCPQCGAPQIRVDVSAATPPLPPGTPGQLQPPAQPVPLAPGQPQPTRVEWSQALSGAAIAGAILAVGTLVPWATFCLWPIAGGALAVGLYQRRHAGAVTPGMGARVGVVAGFLGFVIFAIFASLAMLASRGQWIRGVMQQVIQQQAERNPNPAAQEMLQKLGSPEGMVVLLTIGMLVVLAAFLIFSSIGGAIGASLFGKRETKT